MKKEELPILVGLVLVGFFILFILASSVGNLSLTGHVTSMDEFENQTSCEGGGYVWYSDACYDEQPVCDINNLNLCNETSCEGVGYWYDANDNETLTCNAESEPVCDANDLTLCLDEINCTTLGNGYWYDGSCNADEQPSCSNDLTLCLDEINCTTLGNGYWYGSSCNVGAQPVCDVNNLNLCDETNCDGVGYWYDSSCNADEQTCAEEWNCGSWSDCSGTSQTRTCTDTSECGTEEDKPIETQECEEEEIIITTEEDEEETTQTESTTKTVEQIIAEMEASQNTSNEEEISEEKNSESLGEITGGFVEGEFNESECDGCVYDKKKCYNFEKRKNNSYCTEEGWIVQKEINVTCVEDFECLSNSCEEEKCGDYNWLRKFFDWVKNIFVKEIQINENETTVVNSTQ